MAFTIEDQPIAREPVENNRPTAPASGTLHHALHDDAQS
jgi:hypothetical protein